MKTKINIRNQIKSSMLPKHCPKYAKAGNRDTSAVEMMSEQANIKNKTTVTCIF